MAAQVETAWPGAMIADGNHPEKELLTNGSNPQADVRSRG